MSTDMISDKYCIQLLLVSRTVSNYVNCVHNLTLFGESVYFQVLNIGTSDARHQKWRLVFQMVNKYLFCVFTALGFQPILTNALRHNWSESSTFLCFTACTLPSCPKKILWYVLEQPGVQCWFSSASFSSSDCALVILNVSYWVPPQKHNMKP